MINPEKKTHGYPNFMEPTPNIQTRNPETDNVMEKALKRFEAQLEQADDSQKNDLARHNNSIKMERVRLMAEQRAKMI